MAATLHSISPKHHNEDEQQNLLNFESLDSCLKKNECDLEWSMVNRFKRNLFASNDIKTDEFFNKSSLCHESGLDFSALSSETRPNVTKSLSDLNLCQESFELFNVSTPELISGHICEDVCICFCNSKLRRANRLRNLISMHNNEPKGEMVDNGLINSKLSQSLSSFLVPQPLPVASTTLLDTSCSPSLSPPHDDDGDDNDNTISTSSIDDSKQHCKTPKFCDELYKLDNPYHSCPTSTEQFCGPTSTEKFCGPTSTEKFCGPTSTEQFCGPTNSLISYDPIYDETLLSHLIVEGRRFNEVNSLKRIQNEISVIRLKQDIVSRDYHRRKWMNLEEQKLVQKSKKVDDGMKMKKKLEEMDCDLLKLSEKYEQETEVIKNLLNGEYEKLSLIYTRHHNFLTEITNKMTPVSSSSSWSRDVVYENKETSICTEGNVVQFHPTEELCNYSKNLSMEEVNKSGLQDISTINCNLGLFQCENVEGDNKKVCVDARYKNNILSLYEERLKNVLNTDAHPHPTIEYRVTHHPKSRPLTRYLPIKSDEFDFDLRIFIEQAGHSLDLCKDIMVTGREAKGFLKKVGRKFRTWNRRWFIFDRNTKQLCYYSSQSELILKGRIPFQMIEDVYIDDTMIQCTKNKSTFCLKTLHKTHLFAAPSNRARQIWIDALVTGAEAYQDYFL